MMEFEANWVIKVSGPGGSKGVYVMESGVTKADVLAEVERSLDRGAEVVTIETPRDKKIS